MLIRLTFTTTFPTCPRPVIPRSRPGIWFATCTSLLNRRGGSVNSAYDQATAIVEAFLQIMGWPAGVDAISLAHFLLTHNLELSPMQSFNALFGEIPQKLRAANPNAEFGLSKDAYVGQLNALKDSFEYFTGSADLPPDVLRMAIDQGWTQAEMLDFLKRDSRYSNPALMPWLSQGMGYRDVKNQFFQIYGKNPNSSTQLASWWNFRTGAEQVSGSQAAAIVVGQGPQKNLP